MQSKGEARMTLDELKAGAKALGYKLIKDNPKPKLLRCTCGAKQFHWWMKPLYDKTYWEIWQLECKKCGKKSEWADSERKAIEKWNEMIESEMNNG